jgi:hypothetical protein
VNPVPSESSAINTYGLSNDTILSPVNHHKNSNPELAIHVRVIISPLLYCIAHSTSPQSSASISIVTIYASSGTNDTNFATYALSLLTDSVDKSTIV